MVFLKPTSILFKTCFALAAFLVAAIAYIQKISNIGKHWWRK